MANEVRTNEDDIKQHYQPNSQNKTIDFKELVKNLDLNKVDKKIIDPNRFPSVYNKETIRWHHILLLWFLFDR